MLRPILLLALLFSTPALAITLVSDDFDTTSGGLGWAVGSSWALPIVTTTPYTTSSAEHVQSTTADVLRGLDANTASDIQAESDVWVGFVARLGGPKQSGTFGGVSFYASGIETVFLGATHSGTTWGIEKPGSSPGSSGVEADAAWVSLAYHFDFTANQIDLYVDGINQASYFAIPSRQWDAVRIKHGGSNPLYVDQLRVGTSLGEVLPTIAVVSQSTQNGPTKACKPEAFTTCTSDADCSSFCETSGNLCTADSDCGPATCSNSGLGCTVDSDCDDACESTCAHDPNNVCLSSSDCGVGPCTVIGGTCSHNATITCTDDNGCADSCVPTSNVCSRDGSITCSIDPDCSLGPCISQIGSCANNASISCTVDDDCSFGSCGPGPGACSLGGGACSTDADCSGTCNTTKQCSGFAMACNTDADCQTACSPTSCENSGLSCNSDSDCGGNCNPSDLCLPDTCEVNQNQDTPVYSWKLCPSCGQTGVSGSSVVVPRNGIPYDHTGQGECLFDQATTANDAVIAYSPLVLSGGFDCCIWLADCSPVGTCGVTEGTVNFAWGSEVGQPVLDPDADGLPSGCDNCPDAPNFGTAGTCTAGDSAKVGTGCAADAACGSGGECSLNQEDLDGDGIGDACALPEPGSSAMLVAGIGLLSVLYRRRLSARPR
jgi:hypothetical protein